MTPDFQILLIAVVFASQIAVLSFYAPIAGSNITRSCSSGTHARSIRGSILCPWRSWNGNSRSSGQCT